MSRIHVSTARPWASATVTFYFNREAGNAIMIERTVHGEWLPTKRRPDAEKTGCEIEMRRADQENLGVDGGGDERTRGLWPSGL